VEDFHKFLFSHDVFLAYDEHLLAYSVVLGVHNVPLVVHSEVWEVHNVPWVVHSEV